MTTRILIAMTLAAALTLTGCDNRGDDDADPNKTTAEDVQRETGEAAAAIGEYSAEQAKQLRAEMHEQLEALDQEIAELRERGDELSEDARQEWEQQMANVKEQREVVEQRLDELQEASAETWEDTKQGARDAWDNLQQAYDDAVEYMNSETDNGGA